jgi:hypothetical protein
MMSVRNRLTHGEASVPDAVARGVREARLPGLRDDVARLRTEGDGGA